MTLRTFNPAQVAAVPELELGAVRLEEAWVTDLRQTAPPPAAAFLLLFDQDDAPIAGDEPIAAALRTCPGSTVGLDWTGGAPELLAHGWVALSSDPLVYAPLAPSQDFQFTARVVS